MTLVDFVIEIALNLLLVFTGMLIMYNAKVRPLKRELAKVDRAAIMRAQLTEQRAKTTKIPTEAIMIGHVLNYKGVRVAVDSEPEHTTEGITFTARPMEIVANPYKASLPYGHVVEVEL